MQRQQILVASDEDLRPGRNGAAQDVIVIRIARGLDGRRNAPEGFLPEVIAGLRDARRRPTEFHSEGLDQFFLQGDRDGQAVRKTQPLMSAACGTPPKTSAETVTLVSATTIVTDGDRPPPPASAARP